MESLWSTELLREKVLKCDILCLTYLNTKLQADISARVCPYSYYIYLIAGYMYSRRQKNVSAS